MNNIINEQPDDLIVHVGTNDLNNNLIFLNNVKKMFNKVFMERHRHPSWFSCIINGKDKMNIQKVLTNTNASLKNFCIQKGISFIDNSGIKEFHLGKRKLHLNKKEDSAFAKKLLRHLNRADLYLFL